MNKYESIGVRMSAATKHKKQRNTIGAGDVEGQSKFFTEPSQNDLGLKSKAH